MKKKLSFIVLTFLFISSINAQEGFRIGISVGPTLGDSSEYFSYTLQADFQYLWSVSDDIYIGATTGALVFLGEGNNADGSGGLFSSIPDVFIPIAMASRVKLSELFYIGLDIGYALNANGFGDSDGSFIDEETGGFYFRPLFAYKVKEKLDLALSYTSISENEDNSSSINLGVNFGF
ncbi:hypothetical protein [Cellulophaga sp. Hel_I_12]|uniref:hypothetical protein n=1 Tax=Cellulophaga sp. Hel_I_12 TaxID=1249972 RepID=UPI00064647D2|nr:hypothetical protein [Cellulophaga sp. Hel_I_12]